jgi:hypothetical protein
MRGRDSLLLAFILISVDARCTCQLVDGGASPHQVGQAEKKLELSAERQ